ncbi:PQQ-binding-like beta-propeller repeat protein [Salinicoccus hispanicus]|uniref:PQQ-binding-like beta-propeller repeat protein n=2 Tax=Salinicoccus hispanicus TaxID=157225 RepID=A0A6N8U1Y9_9STAP|nr:PQQ-binding-like beta-propeller repeat protein [Salinicoccus hispanicus]
MKYHILTGILLLGACSNTQDAAVEEGRSEAFGAEEWTQYRHSPDKNAVIDSGHEPLEYAALETEDEIRATPVVADGRLFIGNHNSGDIMAFDLTSGERIWEGKAPNWIHSETIYHEGTIYVGYGNRHFQENGIRGTGENGVMALDAENGEVLWQFETEGEVMPTPAIYEDHLYITTGDRHLYKIGLEEGSLVHQHELGSTISMSSPNIYEDTLYVGGSGPLPYTFYAYDLENDEMKWQTEFPEVVMGLDDVPPAISNGIIVTSALVLNEEEQTEHEIYAMDAKTGELLWKDNWGSGQPVINNKSGAPMIYEDTVFIASPKTKTYYAYDLQSGEQLWAYEDAAAKAAPVAYDGIVYFSNTEGRVIGMDIQSGEPVKEMTLGGTLAPSGPIIVNDTLFVGSQDGNVYIVPLSDFEDAAE